MAVSNECFDGFVFLLVLQTTKPAIIYEFFTASIRFGKIGQPKLIFRCMKAWFCILGTETGRKGDTRLHHCNVCLEHAPRKKMSHNGVSYKQLQHWL
jgi:hypothetical protein